MKITVTSCATCPFINDEVWCNILGRRINQASASTNLPNTCPLEKDTIEVVKGKPQSKAPLRPAWDEDPGETQEYWDDYMREE